jgi:tetratricopeptide (TPR) repeat protein
LSCTAAFSQKQVRKEIREGNKEFEQKKFTEAEISYRKALELNAQSKEAAYNLGSSLYRQQKFDDAAKQFELSAADVKDKSKIATSFHNYGNSFLSKAIVADAQAGSGGQMQAQGANVDQHKMQDLQQSIDAYKQSLRSNPADDETRYNLALAQKLLEQEKQNGDGGGKNNKQDKQQDQQDKKDQQQQPKDKQEQEQQQQMQKDKAEQILEAMKQNERETQEKVNEHKMQAVKQRKTDKNW